MASTYTSRIRLEKQGDGENANTWGLRLNENVIDLIDEAISGYEEIDMSGGAVTLTENDGSSDQSRNFGLKLTGAITSDVTVTIPAQEKIYFINNQTTGSHTVFIKNAGGTAVSVVDQGFSSIVASNGTSITSFEEPDTSGFATSIQLAATSAALQGDIDANASVITALSATLETRIATVSTTMATSIATVSATLESRIATTSATLQTAIDDAVIPSGTKMLFQQTNAPTGWTKDTTHNDKAIRIVSGSVGTGGTVAFDTAFASKTPTGSVTSTPSLTVSGTVGSHSLTIAEIPAHYHIQGYSNNATYAGRYGTESGVSSNIEDGFGTSFRTTAPRTSETGSGDAHDHTWSGTVGGSISSSFTGNAINLDVQYVDFIIATKD